MKLTRIQRKIVKTIQHLYQRKEPLNITAVKRRHPELMEAVYAVKPYWGWKKALEAAGISYCDIKVELQDYCECEICHGDYMHLANHLRLKHDIYSEDYLIDYPGADLLSEALRSQLKIIKSKELPHWEPIWTLEYALDRLMGRYEKGLPINSMILARYAHEPILHLISAHFGSYDNALKWLGLNPDAVRRRPVHIKTKQQVLNGIARRRHLNLPLNWVAVLHGDSLLWKAGRRLFGDWKKAIKAAGLDYNAIRTKPIYPTKGKMIQEIKRRLKEGLPLTVFEIRRGKHADQALYKKALDVFHSWRQALLAAHVPYKDMPKIGRLLRFPTKESVVAEIQRRQKKGLSIRFSDILRGSHADQTLYYVALQYFDQWIMAVKRAGFSYWDMYPRGTYHSAAQALDEIRRRRREGIPINCGNVIEGKHQDSALYQKALGLFGSWGKAVEAAGFSYDKIRLKRRSLKKD